MSTLTADSAQTRVLNGSRSWLVWALATSFVIFVFSLQTGFAVTSGAIQQSLGLTMAQIGLVGSMYTYAFCLIALPSGSLLDRFGVRRVVPLAIACVTLGTFIFANADSLSMLLVGHFLMGCGGAFGFVSAGFVSATWFTPARFGLMFGLVQALASTAATLGQGILSDLVQTMAWGDILTNVAYAGVVLTIAVALLVPSDYQPQENAEALLPSLFAKVKVVLSNPQVWVAALVGGASFGVLLATGALWGFKLAAVRGYENVGIAAYLWFGLAAGAPLLAAFSEKVQNRKLPLIIFLVAQLALLAALVYMPNLSESVAAILFFAFGFAAAAHMLGFSVAGDITEGAVAGTAVAVVNMTMFLIGGLLMMIPGMLIEAPAEGAAMSLANLQPGMMALVGVLAVALVLVLGLRESHPARQK